MNGPHDRDRWATLKYKRCVLAVVRTSTSVVRLLEALRILQGAGDIEVLFTVDGSSRFSGRVSELLEDEGIDPIPWSDRKSIKPDLVLTASENVDLDAFDAPVVVLPHGIGFNKYVPDSRGDGYRLSGLVPADRLRRGNVWIGVSHPDFQEQLRAEYPEAAERCVVIGDPAYDRMSASQRKRDRYRQRLAVGDRKLVVLSSTWKEGSLFGVHRDLPLRLLGELPADEYAVALVLHPNIWSVPGRYGIRQCLAKALEAGLILIPPTEGWQAALVAADVVMGDHGSGTLYACGLGKPVILVAMGNEVVLGTPPARLARTAPWLDANRPFEPQIRQAIDEYEVDMYRDLAEGMFAHRGDAALQFARLVYELLDLPLGPVRSTRTVSEPAVNVDRVVSFRTFTRIKDGGDVGIWRFPASLEEVRQPVEASGDHLVVSDDENDYRLLENASIIVGHEISGMEKAEIWLSDALGRYPGARIAAARLKDGCLVHLRDGRRVRVRTTLADPGVAASVVYAHLCAGDLTGGPLRVRVGPATTSLTLEIL